MATTTPLQKAITYHKSGKLSKAESLYRKIVRQDHTNADAWHLLGVLFYQMGEADIAVNTIQKAIRLNPKTAAYYSNLGLALHAKKAYAQAEANYRQALALQPAYPEALNNLANTLRERSYKGTEGVEEAMTLYQKALTLNPAYPDALNNLATLYIARNEYQTALGLLEKAVGYDRGFAKGYNNLGLVYRHLKRYDPAVAAFEKALSLPDRANPFTLGALFETKKAVCDWEGLEALETRLVEKALHSPQSVRIDPFTTISHLSNISKADQYRLLQNYTRFAVDGDVAQFAHAKRPKTKLRIGYLTADLFDHPTMHLASGLFGAHDKSRFEVVLFGLYADETSHYFQKAAADSDRYVDLSTLGDQAAAEAIYDAGIDILIDLQGLTKNSRPQILAYRPAPVQTHYLAFAGTTAHPAVDYILGDGIVTPDSDAAYYSEQLIKLPDCYQVNDGKQAVAEKTPSRAACGLPEEGFVFCCFNNSYKIEPMIFSHWMEILQETPGSVLWLYESNPAMKVNLQNEAQKRGVAKERLVFAQKLPKPEHLARLKNADLFLDSYYYNAHTTASDALFVGVPLITVAGDRFASRVAASLLHSVGMESCIAPDMAHYKARAVAWANDPAAFGKIKARLEAGRRNGTLFDTARFAKNLEKALEAAWERYAQNEKPQMITIESEVA